MKSNKLIKNLDEQTWNKFVAFCKLKNVKVAPELEIIINTHLDKNLKQLFNKK
ncbi:hypothetical protein HN592_01630 [Candidatus Woesearchaeota archaeon]|jgi:hypothetical protein|nr:hypothetical protein [Candidatus Woesearchaeota archaeon]MBT4368615.1 hypothetical protein [Candidatus Woesearchaeota archaeon]MBT4713076.1 hypothetical protein [Candidatus Woesearchaeota archaeon]MBT6638998.1 hypothetical protein [Candidatus Woesearchaeota archaeon]MBT7134197.1 hypothetical protein [Candidatus Woesearchaeota archaeon]